MRGSTFWAAFLPTLRNREMELSAPLTGSTFSGDTVTDRSLCIAALTSEDGTTNVNADGGSEVKSTEPLQQSLVAQMRKVPILRLWVDTVRASRASFGEFFIGFEFGEFPLASVRSRDVLPLPLGA